LRNRNAQDHEATAMMKAQFMSLWDGLITDPNCTVIVMGATNRPQDLDRAILRRMPATFHIGLPVSFPLNTDIFDKSKIIIVDHQIYKVERLLL
jgi:SpoVK/Ycf46/Vps4 family AAA+-type ATPase